MAIVTISKTEDYLLNFGTNSYIEYKRVYSGNGLTVCSWIKLRNSYIAFFDTETENEEKSPLFGELDFSTKKIFGSASVNNDDFARTSSNEFLSVVKNYSTWFHVCIIRNESFINFYVNDQPVERFTERDKPDPMTKNIKLNIQLGSLYQRFQNGSFFQANIFDRSIIAKEAADMYNCESVEGDFLSWSKIISKSPDVSFENNIFLVKGDVPCPTSSLNAAGMSNSRDPGSSSGSSNQAPSTGSSNQSPSSGSSNQSPSSGSSNPVPNSDNNEPGSSSNQGSSSEDDIPGSSSAK